MKARVLRVLCAFLLQIVCYQQRHIDELREEIAAMVREEARRDRIG